VHTIYLLENLKEREHSKDQGTDGKILEWMLTDIGWEGMDWMHLAWDRDQWQALVNVGNFLTSLVTVSFSKRTPLHVVS